MSQEYKYFVSNLLTRESWKWFYLNDKKTATEPHGVLISLEIMEEPTGDLSDLIEALQSRQAEHQADYERIFIEKVSLNRGCGDYGYEWHLVGERLENETELARRLQYQQDLEQQKINEQLAQEQAKELKQFAKFLKLQANYLKADKIASPNKRAVEIAFRIINQLKVKKLIPSDIGPSVEAGVGITLKNDKLFICVV